MRKWLLGIAICLGLAACGQVLLQRGAAVTAPPARQYDVRILRDTWGVPHIFGTTDADVAYGLAYAHAEDDFATFQATLIAARGRLASVFGRNAAPNDYMVHLLRVWDVVEAKYETDLSPDMRAVLEAYAAGLNRYAALHPDEVRSGVLPIRGQDIVAGFVHKVPLFFGLDRTLQDLFADERKHPVSTKRTASALQRWAGLDLPRGSNAFSVGPGRSADGKTRLAVNSHQPWEGPVAWYEVTLHSEEGWDMAGGLFPGSPAITHGHNRHLGWAHTVNQPDLIDVYVLEINPDNRNQYRYDGAWRDLEVRTAPIKVKLWGPFSWTFKREVLWSVYGPAVRRPHGTYAIRFATWGEVRQVEQWFRMNKARTFDEWLDAMRMAALPSFNTAYGDEAGNIYYVYNGRLPLRAEGYDWSQYLPGNTSETLWTEYLPYDDLPQVKNPASGFVINCNSSPFRATTGPGNPSAAAYSPTLGIETRMTNRSLRALELFGNDESITAEEFYRYKYDMAYSTESEVAALVQKLLAAPPSEDPVVREAMDVLRAWDLGVAPENRHAAIAVLTAAPVLTAQFQGKEPPDLFEQFATVAHELRRAHGRIDVPWQDVNRLRRGSVDLGLGGGPDVLHAVYGDTLKDGRITGRAGDCFVMLVEWGEDGVQSQSIHQYGSATLDESSPHYADQAPLFVKRQLKPVWMDEADIRAHLEREYRPGEEVER